MGGRIIRGYAERMEGYWRVLETRSTITPSDRLRELAGDEIRPVRVWAARSHNTPADALDRLAQDEDGIVQWNALLHTRTPTQALVRLAGQEQDRYGDRAFVVRAHVVHHPNTPPCGKAS